MQAPEASPIPPRVRVLGRVTALCGAVFLGLAVTALSLPWLPKTPRAGRGGLLFNLPDFGPLLLKALALPIILLLVAVGARYVGVGLRPGTADTLRRCGVVSVVLAGLITVAMLAIPGGHALAAVAVVVAGSHGFVLLACGRPGPVAPGPAVAILLTGVAAVTAAVSVILASAPVPQPRSEVLVTPVKPRESP